MAPSVRPLPVRPRCLLLTPIAGSPGCLQVSLRCTTSAILDHFLTLSNSTIFRKNYVFLSVVFVSAFGMEIAFDNASNSVWNTVNKGRQWKDLKHKYMESDDE
ncbi:hypothetical protein D6D19_02731 [Aureobasidium pullulans]|uniref:Complex III subunit 9 n=1 Tax=Aureobasidium pullulans TaxID=5580 RepID=A0A4S9KMM2_AURPU|nr:hypothetical protein D6D29_04604 [Aureobasidium pullulans]THW76937.1 hypothetical protein D6D19_02731 [Aureobasidium pullulans]THY17152.1 hypothetical protein D6D00_08613 [Aureobasidium pullulans]TIA17993.1 hypothetical protein D6C81_05303 [Aureobasidium pullulans]